MRDDGAGILDLRKDGKRVRHAFILKAPFWPATRFQEFINAYPKLKGVPKLEYEDKKRQ